MSKKDNSIYDRAKTWEVIISGIFSNWPNLYFLLLTLYVMLYSTDNLLLGAGVVGTIISLTKVIDALTDPIIGKMIDNSKMTKGKYRFFKFIGLLFMALGAFLLFGLAPSGSGAIKISWVFFSYLIWVIGYTFAQTAFLSFNAIITTDPKQRQLISMFTTISTLIIAVFIGALVPGVLDAGGVDNQATWRSIVTWIIIVNVLMYGLELLAIKRKDNENYYHKVVEHIKLSEVFITIKENIAHRQLIVAATTNKLANGVYLASASYLYIYVVKNLSLQGTVALITIPIGIIGAIIGTIIANKVGQKEEFVGASWYAIVVCVLAIVINPFSSGNVIFIIVLMTLFSLSNTLTTVTIQPMISACIDYEEYTNKRYIPSSISASYSFVEKLAFALSNAVVGGVLMVVGYKANMEPTLLLTAGILFLVFIIPILGHVASILAMRKYPISRDFFDKMMKEKQAGFNPSDSQKGKVSPIGNGATVDI